MVDGIINDPATNFGTLHADWNSWSMFSLCRYHRHVSVLKHHLYTTAIATCHAQHLQMYNHAEEAVLDAEGLTCAKWAALNGLPV